MFEDFNMSEQATLSSSSDQEDGLSLVIGDVHSLLDTKIVTKKTKSKSQNIYRDLQNTTERCALKDLVFHPEMKELSELNGSQNNDNHLNDDIDFVKHEVDVDSNMFDLNKEPVILFQPEMKNWGGVKVVVKTEGYEELTSDSEDKNECEAVLPNQPPRTPDSLRSSYEQEDLSNYKHNQEESGTESNSSRKRARSPERVIPSNSQIPKKKVKAGGAKTVTNKFGDSLVSHPEVGTLVWAKMKGFPPWPAMVAPDPKGKLKDKVRKKEEGLVECYHVIFLESANQRAWIPTNCITHFTGSQGDCKYVGSRAIAVDTAEMLLDMDIEARIECFDKVQVTTKNVGNSKKKGGRKIVRQNPYYRSDSESDSGIQPDSGLEDEEEDEDEDDGFVDYFELYEKLSMSASVRLRRLPLPTNSATISFRRMGQNEFKCRICHKIFSKKNMRDAHEKYFHVKPSQDTVEPLTSVFIQDQKKRVSPKPVTKVIVGRETASDSQIKPLTSVFIQVQDTPQQPKIKPLFIETENLKTDKHPKNPKVLNSHEEIISDTDSSDDEDCDTFSNTSNTSNTETMNDPTPDISKSQLSWSEGDLVWAKMAGWCYWPCLVSLDPSYSLTKVTKPTGNYVSVHVTFLAYGGQHAWVGHRSVVKFVRANQFQEEKRNKKVAKNYVPKKSVEKTFTNAVKQAEILNDLSPEQRLETLDIVIVD